VCQPCFCCSCSRFSPPAHPGPLPAVARKLASASTTRAPPHALRSRPRTLQRRRSPYPTPQSCTVQVAWSAEASIIHHLRFSCRVDRYPRFIGPHIGHELLPHAEVAFSDWSANPKKLLTALWRCAYRAGIKPMSHRAYRLITLHQTVDEAISLEMKRQSPNRLRLLRLRTMKLALRQRLGALLNWRAATV
jgi:hypothetical protein